ncbi:hypothetical protein KA183_04315 [bacterium]|nr:hypothetical protein [bacterium]
MLKDNDYVGLKINKLLANSNRVNSYVFGDSTADSLCSFADMSNYKVILNTVTRYDYNDAKFAQDQIGKQLELPLKIKNAYFGGCLISDQHLMLKKLLEAGNRPKVVFLTVVPRPFLDTTVEEKVSPVKCYFEHRHRNLSQVHDFVELIDYLLTSSSNIYRTRSDYATILSSLACTSFGRPLNSFSTTKIGITNKNKVSLVGDEKVIDPDKNSDEVLSKFWISHYKNAYLFDQKTYDFQISCFKEMLCLLKLQNIETIVIKLPLGEKNLALIPKETSSKWNEEINVFAHRYDAHVIDLQKDSRFSSQDFLDTVHLSGPGAIKTWLYIIDDIKKNDLVWRKLKDQFKTEN